jgi:disulfide oxidoreductase YuzD
MYRNTFMLERNLSVNMVEFFASINLYHSPLWFTYILYFFPQDNMARALETINDINDSKYTWKVAVLVKDLWVATNYKNIKHVEMVLADKMVWFL